MGVASIGVGTGLFSASASPEVLVMAFAPAVLAILIIAVKSTFVRPALTFEEPASEEAANG